MKYTYEQIRDEVGFTDRQIKFLLELQDSIQSSSGLSKEEISALVKSIIYEVLAELASK